MSTTELLRDLDDAWDRLTDRLRAVTPTGMKEALDEWFVPAIDEAVERYVNSVLLGEYNRRFDEAGSLPDAECVAARARLSELRDAVAVPRAVRSEGAVVRTPVSRVPFLVVGGVSGGLVGLLGRIGIVGSMSGAITVGVAGALGGELLFRAGAGRRAKAYAQAIALAAREYRSKAERLAADAAAAAVGGLDG